MAVRPEFGPSLPALLAARGVSRRVMAVGAVVLAGLAVGGWTFIQSLRDREHLTDGGPPVFNLVYAPSALHERPARDGELARIEGRLKRIAVEITVRRIEVPPYPGGDIVGGYLPVLAERRIAELRDIYGPVQILDEGKSRINRLPGYQIGFSARTSAGRRLFGRDTYVLPDDASATEGVLVTLRRMLHGRQRTREDAFFDKAKEAVASFAFGEDQP